MTDLLERAKAYMNSPEGQIAMQKAADDLKAAEEREDRYIDKVHQLYGNDIDSLIKKILDKYNSDKYVKKEYSLGYEPREDLLWLLFEYAQKYGTEANPLQWERYSNMFTGSLYELGSYMFNLMHGQGSTLRVDKREFI